jgi:hypothetical protein
VRRRSEGGAEGRVELNRYVERGMGRGAREGMVRDLNLESGREMRCARSITLFSDAKPAEVGVRTGFSVTQTNFIRTRRQAVLMRTFFLLPSVLVLSNLSPTSFHSISSSAVKSRKKMPAHATYDPNPIITKSKSKSEDTDHLSIEGVVLDTGHSEDRTAVVRRQREDVHCLRCCNGYCMCLCFKKRSNCLMFTLVFLVILGFFIFPRDIEISVPVEKLEDVLRKTTDNSISFDLFERAFVVKTNWPLSFNNRNFVPLFADIKSLDLYYPGLLEDKGTHIARAVADDFQMPALKEKTNWIEIDAHVTPTVAEQLQMYSQFTADCGECKFVLPKNCAATTIFWVDAQVHLSEDKMGFWADVLGDVAIKTEVELSCAVLWPCEEGDPCDGE